MNSVTVHGFSAATAGTIATLATHPFDVIKVPSYSPCLHPVWILIQTQTKIQVRQEERYRGFLRTVSTVWKVCNVLLCGHSIDHVLSNAVPPVSSTVFRSGSPDR